MTPPLTFKTTCRTNPRTIAPRRPGPPVQATSVEGTSEGKRELLNGLAPEVSDHQSIGETSPLEFNTIPAASTT